MGESIADLKRYPDKMLGETTASNPVLEVSVSFGRFENDSLSWERWSAFSPNKYLEEVEKCATPGSVAQKKAYFEAHYKRIAARKAELLEQERQAQSDSNGRDMMSNGGSSHEEIYVSEDRSLGEEVKQDESGLSDEIGTDTNRDDLREEEEVISKECQISVVEREEEIDRNVFSDRLRKSEDDFAAKEVEGISIESEPDKIEAPAGVESELGCDSEIRDVVIKEVEVVSIESKPEKVEAPESVKSDLGCDSEIKDVVVNEVEVVSTESKSEKKEASEIAESELGCISKIKDVKLKLGDQKESQKVTTGNKERSAAKIKKKPESPNPITRTPKSSIPRLSNSKLISTASRISASAASQSSAKKGNTNTPSLLKNKSSSAGEAKKVVSKSLNMSPSLGPANSDSPSLSANRKSLFMEKMGDKDIVKRAFKAFQRNFNQVKSYGDGSPLQKQVSVTSVKRTEPKVSTSVTPRKENGGLLKTNHLDKRSVKTPPHSCGLKSDDRTEKRKEFSKKLEQKPNAAEAEKTRLQLRSKEAKDAEMKKLRQSLNFKATPMPAFYRGQKLSKSALDKLPSKNETCR